MQQAVASNMSKPVINCDEIWGKVNSPNFVNATPTNEHDRHSVKGMVALMLETRNAINNPEQMGMNQDQVHVFEDKLRQMKELLAEECMIARRVDPKVPRVRRRGQRWEAY